MLTRYGYGTIRACGSVTHTLLNSIHDYTRRKFDHTRRINMTELAIASPFPSRPSSLHYNGTIFYTYLGPNISYRQKRLCEETTKM